MSRPDKQVFRLLEALFLGLFAAAPVWAQPADEDIRQTVARVSYLSGSVSYARGDDPDDWQSADLNVPMTIGDRLYAGDNGRAELQGQGGFFVRLGAHADLAALNLTDDTKQWSLRLGTAAFHLRRLGENELFEVDTPNAAITFERAGQYRVDVDPDGNSRVVVWRGRAVVAAGGGQVPLNAGDEMAIEGIDSPRYDVFAAGEPDGFDRWAGERERRFERARAHQYVHADIVGAAELDEYGRWQRIPQYGWVWTPAVVEAGWQPYRTGHWVWQDPWGWTWVAFEPWGWAPYHYGRWVVWSSRWYWVPVAPSVRVVSYAPALVAFTGGGSGWSASVRVGGGGGFIGWFPLAPRDPLLPWWGRRASVGANVTRETYVNRTYVTVINHNTFVSGGVVATNIVRDPAVVNTVMRAPVMRGPLPVVPTTASLRLAVRPGLPAPPQPPQAGAARAVVVRAAPPPPPPTFQTKVEVIQRNNGAPVAPATAARMATENRATARPVVAVRPATGEQGRVTLTPKTENARQRPPEPVAPLRGRAPASPEGAPVPSAQATPVGRPAVGQAPVGERGRRAFETPVPSVQATPVPRPPAGQAPVGERGHRAFETPVPSVQATPAPRPPAGQAPVGERGRRAFETPVPSVQATPVPRPPAEQAPVGERGRRSFQTPVPSIQATPVPRPAAGGESVRPTVARPPEGERKRPDTERERPSVERREPERGRAGAAPPTPQPAPESQKEKPKEKGKEKEKPKGKEKPTPQPE